MTAMWFHGVLIVALPLGVASQTVSIPAIADTGLREVFATEAGGSETGFRVGNTSSTGADSRNRALIRFDLAGAVPAGAEITDVSLRLTVNRTIDAGSRVFELRRVFLSWDESQATWSQRSDAIPWTAPGGMAGADFSSTVSAATTVGGLGTYTWGSTPGMVADARHWQSNALENFGWMLLINPEGVAGTARKFYSHESVIDPPMLDITYKPPFRIDSAQISGTNLCITFTATLGRSYVVQRRDDIAAGDWLVLTNLPTAKMTGPVTVCDTLGALRHCYRVGESNN